MSARTTLICRLSGSDLLRFRRAWSLSATFFDREAASNHYINRTDRHIRMLKTLALIDTKSCSVLAIHCSPHWSHDTQVGSQVVLRNTADIESFAGDKGHDDHSLRDTLRTEDIRSVIKYRLFAAYDHAHNARQYTYRNVEWLRRHFQLSSIDPCPPSGHPRVP
ncbi:transposase [Natrinema sp. LN54]|uniref:transposase n=1 Tax=Natrinema sp. LN54 TaxID=3458705 RepID=UPI004035B2B7